MEQPPEDGGGWFQCSLFDLQTLQQLSLQLNTVVILTLVSVMYALNWENWQKVKCTIFHVKAKPTGYNHSDK